MKLTKIPAYPQPLPVFEDPWQLKTSRQVYKNPWLEIREDAVITPGGSDGIYGVVDTRIATAVVALDDNKNVYLVGQYRYPTKHYSWEIVEGGCEGSDSALETAKRELREEAGLVAMDWMQLGDEIHLSNCISSEIGFIFLARDLKEVESSPEETEQLCLIKIPFAEALLRVESGEIRDSMSIIGLYRAKRALSY